MWTYWRDKYDYEHAAEVYYPATFKSDPVLWLALKQLAHVKASIDKRMEELSTEARSQNDGH
jgi:hypothetical protein